MLEWLEGSLYTAAVEAGGRFAEAPSQAGPELGLRSVTVLPPAAKLSDWFTGTVSPEWSRRDWRGQAAYDVNVILHRDGSVAEAVNQVQASGWGVVSESPEFQRLVVRVPERELVRLAELDSILYIEPATPPIEHFDNSVSASMLKGTDLFGAPFGLTGKDVKVAQFDSGRVSVHQDLRGRVTNLENYNFDSSHATHVAGTIAGSGASDPARKGLAPESQLYWGVTSGDPPTKTIAAVANQGVVAVNNSWGLGLSGAGCNLIGSYPSIARDYDRLIRENPASIVFAMGNSRAGETCGLIPTRGGYYSTSIPASAKNVISVGAISRETAASYFSNYGPTRDGRLKPDVVALGVDVHSLGTRDNGATMSGTSMSARITGSIALLAQRFQQKHSISKPDPALVKAVLTGTATDLGSPGPDYSYGYGLPNLVEAVRVIDEKQYDTARVSSGEWSRTISVPGGPRLSA